MSVKRQSNELVKKSGLVRRKAVPGAGSNGGSTTKTIVEDRFKDIHYFRNKLNKVPTTLGELMNEKNKWEMLLYYKAAFHMNGDDGIFNLKFVSNGDQLHEAVYDKDEKLLTETNDPLNMGTYNYVGPDDVDGHIDYDIEPYYKWGNTSILGGKGALVEISAAVENVLKFVADGLISQHAQNHYNIYARQFGLPEFDPYNVPTHQPW